MKVLELKQAVIEAYTVLKHAARATIGRRKGEEDRREIIGWDLHEVEARTNFCSQAMKEAPAPKRRWFKYLWTMKEMSWILTTAP